MSNVTQWADAFFCAAHKGADGRLHGHTWRVRAHWPGKVQSDIVARQALLKEVVAALDHDELPEGLSRAEEIAAVVGQNVVAVRVDVWREAEGLGATWTA